MTLTISLERHGVPLSTPQEQRIHRHLTGLGRRVQHRPDPQAVLAFSRRDARREVVASLRIQLGPLGPTLAASQVAQTPDRAARLAIEAVERQLERLVAAQRGEPTYGVPSRRRAGMAQVRVEADPLQPAMIADGA